MGLKIIIAILLFLGTSVGFIFHIKKAFRNARNYHDSPNKLDEQIYEKELERQKEETVEENNRGRGFKTTF